MPMRPCLDCGRPSHKTRCPACQPRRASAHRLGYTADHRRATAEAIDLEPWCHTAGGCPYPDAGTAANRLTGGHPRMVAEFGGDREAWAEQQVVPQCHRCNSGHRPIA